MIDASTAFLNELAKPARKPIYQVRMYRPNAVIAYWKLEETSGSRADSVGSHTLTDNATVTSNPGKVGTAAQFTAASNEYLSCTPSAAMLVGDENFSVWAWAYLDSTGTIQTIASQWGSSSGTKSWYLRFSAVSGKFEFGISDGSGTTFAEITYDAIGALSTATWYFVYAYRSKSNEIGMSVNNGAIETTSTTIIPVTTTEDFRIGQRESSHFFNGRIDEVGFAKAVLTADQVTTLYNGGFGLAQSPVAFANPNPDYYFCTAHPVTNEDIGTEILIPVELDRRVEPELSRFPLSSLRFLLQDIGGQASAVAPDLHELECAFYLGFWDLEWNASPVNYVQLFHGIVTEVEHDGNNFSILARSRMVIAQDRLIFNAAQTQLSAAMTDVATSASVFDADAFEFATDQPQQARRQVVIDNEVMTYRSKTSTTLDSIIRVGAFTFFLPPPIPDGESVAHSQNAIVREVVHLGGLTGTNNSNGGTNDLHPIDHFRTVLTSPRDKVSIGSAAIELNDDELDDVKTALGTDLQTLFRIADPINGKRFLEEEIALIIGAYPTEDNDGSIGLKLFRDTDDFDPVASVTDAQVIRRPEWIRNAEKLINVVIWHYDYNPVVDEFTSTYIYRDDDLIQEHGRELPLIIWSKGVRSFFDADSVISPPPGLEWFDSTADFLEAASQRHIARFGSQAPVISARCVTSCSLLEIGDDVEATFESVLNLTAATRGLENAPFEVIAMRHDFQEGVVDFELLGYPG